MPTMSKLFCWYLTVPPTRMPSIRARSLRPTITSSRPGVKVRPSTTSIPPRTSKARGVTARRVMFAGMPSLRRGRPMTTTHSHEAMGRPSESRAIRSSTTILLRSSRGTPEVSSEAEPRWTIIALSVRPVDLSAALKPSDIDMSTANTATTRAMPPIASRVTCHRTRTLRRL